LDALQKLSEGPLRKCPACKKLALRRLMSAPSFRLKGGGWYETDFKSDGEKKRNLVEAAGAAESSKSDGAKADGTNADGAKTDGAKTDGAKTDGAKADAPAKESKSGDRAASAPKDGKPAAKDAKPAAKEPAKTSTKATSARPASS
jgi:putative FmdB family regulatory protein